MSLFDSKISQIFKNRNDRQNGKFTYIPFKDFFPGLSQDLPGLIPGTMYKLLSYTSIGKSTFTRFVNILLPYEIYKKYNLKFKVIYFALEESKEDFVDNLILYMLYKKHNLIINKYQLNSYSNELIDDYTLEKIKDVKNEVEEILQFVDIVDSITHPTGLYSYCKTESYKLGNHYMIHKSTKEVINYLKYDIMTPTEKSFYNYHEYKLNDPDLKVIVVCDQINNITPEKKEGIMLNQIDSIKRWSMDYCRLTMTKHWKWIVWNVQQLAFAGEGLESKKHNDLKPSLEKAGTSKEVLRDDMVIITLFSPWRYKLAKDDTSYGTYDVSSFKNYYRNVSILKNRHGAVGVEFPLYFKPEIGTFIELPKLDDPSLQNYIIN